MTTNYEKLRERVYEVLYPEGIPLEEGCRIKDFLKGEAVIVGVEHYDSESDCYYQFYDKIPKPEIFLSPRGNWDIIGKPLEIGDVLRAIGKVHNEKKVGIDAGGYLVKRLTYEERHKKDMEIYIDLSLPLSHPNNESACGAVYQLIKK